MVYGWKKQRGFNPMHKIQLRWKEYSLVSQALLQVMALSDTRNYKAELLLWISPAASASSDALFHISFIHHTASLTIQMCMNSMESPPTELSFLSCWQKVSGELLEEDAVVT